MNNHRACERQERAIKPANHESGKGNWRSQLALDIGAPHPAEQRAKEGSYFSIYRVLLPLVSNPSLSFSYDTLPQVHLHEETSCTYFYLSTCLGTYLLNAERTIRSNPATCRSQTKRFPILVSSTRRKPSGSPFFGALAARAQGGIHFRFVKSPSLTPAPQLSQGHATRLEAVKGCQTKKTDP